MNIDVNKVDLTNNNQKVFAGILIVGFLFLLHYLLPPLIVILTNLWIAALLALPLAFVIFNPMLMWNVFKQLSWSLTRFLVSKDKLGFMYRYHEYLLGKIDKLDGNVKNITAMKIKVQRKVSELKESLDNNISRVEHFQKTKASDLVIRTAANKVAIDKKQIEILLPKVVNIESQEKYLIELHRAWAADAEDLKYTLDAKADEFNLLKELAEATGNASEFLKGNTEEYKLYQESLKQIEDSVTRYTASVENFERKVQPILETISANRTVSEDAGLKLIEEYKKSKINLKLEA